MSHLPDLSVRGFVRSLMSKRLRSTAVLIHLVVQREMVDEELFFRVTNFRSLTGYSLTQGGKS